MKSGTALLAGKGTTEPNKRKITLFPRNDGGEQIENLHFQSGITIDSHVRIKL